MNYELLDKAAEHIRRAWPNAAPTCGLILGSGWSEVAEAFAIKDTIGYEAIPGLGKPGVVGHSGRLAWAESAGLETFIFQGRRHFYEGEGWTPVALPVYVLKKFGVSRVMLTNAAGLIKKGLKPGDLMIIDDHLNNFGGNPLIGPHHPIWGPRFPDLSAAYDPALRRMLDRAARKLRIKVGHGVYLASSGPLYETPAEIRRYKAVGADAVGMSTVPETILAHAAGMRVVAISCLSNYAAGISKTGLTHEEVTETTRRVMPKMRKLLLAFWKEMAREKAK
jgi:purine-nucleoside phosphorylase